MGLDRTTEPLRLIAVIITAVLTAVGVALTSLVGAVDAPWIAPAGVAATSAAGILGTWIGIEKGRTVVTPAPNVAALLAQAEPYVEPPDVVAVSPADTDTAGLDAAAEAAGLA